MSVTEEQKKRQDSLVALFGKAPIKKSMGMSVHYDEKGRAIFAMPYNPNFDHALEGVHGGVYATLLDNAGWFTVAPQFETWIVTIEFHVRLLQPVEREDLWSRGEIIRLGKRITFAEMSVWTKDERLIATGSGTFAPTSRPYTS